MSEHLKNESGEEYDEAFDAKKNRLKLERSKQLKLLETTKLEEEFNNAKLSTALIGNNIKENKLIPIIRIIFQVGEQLHKKYITGEKLTLSE